MTDVLNDSTNGDFLTFLKRLYLGATVEDAARAAGCLVENNDKASSDIEPTGFAAFDDAIRNLREGVDYAQTSLPEEMLLVLLQKLKSVGDDVWAMIKEYYDKCEAEASAATGLHAD